MFAANPFRHGTRVYLTNPAGRRVGFTFDPEPEGGLLGTIWHPRFPPDPGVYDQLTVEDTPLSHTPTAPTATTWSTCPTIPANTS